MLPPISQAALVGAHNSAAAAAAGAAGAPQAAGQFLENGQGAAAGPLPTADQLMAMMNGEGGRVASDRVGFLCQPSIL